MHNPAYFDSPWLKALENKTFSNYAIQQMIKSFFSQAYKENSANGVTASHLSLPVEHLDDALANQALKVEDAAEDCVTCIEREEVAINIKKIDLPHHSHQLERLLRNHGIAYTFERCDCDSEYLYTRLSQLNRFGQAAFYYALNFDQEGIMSIQPNPHIAYKIDNPLKPKTITVYKRNPIISHHSSQTLMALVEKLSLIFPGQSAEALLGFLYHRYIKAKHFFGFQFAFIDELAFCQILNLHTKEANAIIVPNDAIDHECQIHAKQLLLYLVLFVLDARYDAEMVAFFGDPTFGYERHLDI